MESSGATIRQLDVAARDLASGTHPADVIETLVQDGVHPEEAKEIVRGFDGALRSERTRAGLGSIALGVFLIVAGGGAAALSLAAGEGKELRFYGIILVGVLSIGHGLRRMLR